MYRLPPRIQAGGHSSGSWLVSDCIFTGEGRGAQPGLSSSARPATDSCWWACGTAPTHHMLLLRQAGCASRPRERQHRFGWRTAPRASCLRCAASHQQHRRWRSSQPWTAAGGRQLQLGIVCLVGRRLLMSADARCPQAYVWPCQTRQCMTDTPTLLPAPFCAPHTACRVTVLS